jgi:hypothetical protein
MYSFGCWESRCGEDKIAISRYSRLPDSFPGSAEKIPASPAHGNSPASLWIHTRFVAVDQRRNGKNGEIPGIMAQTPLRRARNSVSKIPH